MIEREWFDRLQQPCPVPEGTRIRLVAMPNDPCPQDVGALGTVTGGNAGQMHVKWDNGRTLMLIPGQDRWEVVS
jgi:hypothetical protein